MATLHENATIVDGLIISNFSRSVFEEMKAGGLTAANCTCSVWENFRDSVDRIVQWKRWFQENADLILQVRTTADIQRAKREGKVGIILGWQNTSGIEDKLGYLSVFKDLGVHVMQLTYNTQNLSGSGCYESRDSGLSDFGREVVDEMGRVGILCDLSHVGPRTSEDTIRHSKKPVAFSHCCPAGLKQHPRNKSDELLKLIADKGGFVGVTMYPWFLARGNDSTIEDYVDAIEYTINLAGEDHVGFGTDFTQGYGPEFLEYLGHDKGYARLVVRGADPVFPEGIREIRDTPNLTAAMERRRWTEGRIRNIMGGNWVRLFAEVWGS